MIAAHHGLHQFDDAHRAREIGVDFFLAVVFHEDERLGFVLFGEFLAERVGVGDAVDQAQFLGPLRGDQCRCR